MPSPTIITMVEGIEKGASTLPLTAVSLFFFFFIRLPHNTIFIRERKVITKEIL